MLKEFTWCVDAKPTRTTTHRVNTVQFGDGYEQVSSFGINNSRKSWQCTKTGLESEIDVIHDFLDELGSYQPFYMTIKGKKDAYRTTSEISTTQQSGNVWQISFTVKQVFLP